MKKDDFYLGLNIINILLVVYIIGMVVLFFMTMFTNNAAAIWFIVLYVILKILLLPLFFEVIEKFFPKSIFTNIFEELKTNKNSRKSALVLSFTYDAVIMIFGLCLPTANFAEKLYIPITWEIVTLGGICGFYLFAILYWYIAKRLKRQTFRLKINPKAAGFWVNFIKPVLIILPAILFITSFMNNFPIDKVYEQSTQYEKAIRSIYDKNKIKHFPKKIPNEAQNVRFYKASNSFFGSEEIALRFNIDKDYIKKEIDSHRYISVKEPLKPEEQDEDFYVHGIIGKVLNNSSYGINQYKLYIIGTKPEGKAGFPMEYGIAVNYKNNDIIYYYAVVD